MNYEEAFLKNSKKYNDGHYKFYSEIIGNTPINSILEIGVEEGQSLNTWHDIWPNSIIEGIDIKEAPLSIRTKFKIYNQDSFNIYNANFIKNNYDIVIDDGDHNWKSKIRTLFNYYSKANKYYVIESLAGNYSINKLFSKVPALHLTDYYIFNSEGPKRTFSYRVNDTRIEEKNSSNKIIFINIENSKLSKNFINCRQFREELINDDI